MTSSAHIVRRLAACVCMILALMQTPALAATSQSAAPVSEIDLIFAQEREAIEKYGDWVYGWASSYASAYRVAGRLLLSLARNPAAFTSDVLPTIEGFFYEQLRDRVLVPERKASLLTDVIERQADARLFATSRRLAQDACTKGDQTCLREQLARLQAVQASVLATLTSSEVRTGARIEAEKLFDIRPEAGATMLRTTRPIATRAALFLLRVTEFASLLTIVTIALRSAYVPVTSVTTAVAMFIAAWIPDYAIHSIDAAFNRSAYTERIRDTIEQNRPRILEFVGRTHEQIDKDFLALAATRVGSGHWE